MKHQIKTDNSEKSIFFALLLNTLKKIEIVEYKAAISVIYIGVA